jgi:MerR family transcriptional regulator, light-induced transcriptional regulator
VLLAVTPGDSHIFELIDLVGRESFALLGLSISCEDGIPELRRLVPAIRGASVNKALAVMIGGPISANVLSLPSNLAQTQLPAMAEPR